MVCGYILGWRSVAYHFWVTVTLTFDLVFRIIVPRACADPGIFVRGGPGQLDKKKALTFFFFFFFFSPQPILQKSNGRFQRNLSFFKVPEGVQHFPGGSNFFQGGSNCLFPIETHITCDFPGGGGGPDPLSPLWICICRRQKHNQIGIVCFTFCKMKKFLKSLIFGVDCLFDISDI